MKLHKELTVSTRMASSAQMTGYTFQDDFGFD